MDSKEIYNKQEYRNIKGIILRKGELYSDACARILREYFNNGSEPPNEETIKAYEFTRTINSQIMRRVFLGNDLADILANNDKIKNLKNLSGVK